MIRKKQLTIDLIGGLGNQMFQFATGLGVKVKINANDLVLNIEGLKNTFPGATTRHYALDQFCVSEFAKIVENPKRNGVLKKISSLRKVFKLSTSIYREQAFNFNEKIFTQKLPVRLSGYFQSPLYFEHTKEIIKNAFRLNFKPSNRYYHYENKIVNSIISIAIHLRRGDYYSSPSVEKVHGSVGISYYEMAINLLRQIYGEKINFFVFTDDILFASDIFRNNNEFCIIEPNFIKPSEDLILMSKCNSLIIANSSFSWWAAWLKKNNDGLVIAPRAWFGREFHLKNSTIDLYPTGWILI